MCSCAKETSAATKSSFCDSGRFYFRGTCPHEDCIWYGIGACPHKFDVLESGKLRRLVPAIVGQPVNRFVLRVTRPGTS